MLLNEIVETSIKCDRLTAEQKQFILTHCKPYLDQVGYDLDTYALYRGMSDNSINSSNEVAPGIIVKPGHYSNRIPQGTPKPLFDAINDQFTQKFGVPFRNGICTTGGVSWAKLFGITCQIIPIGNFKFCWSKYISDFGEHVMNKLEHIDVTNNQDELTDEAWEFVDDLVSSHSTTDLKTAIRSHNEVAIYCDHCLIITSDRTSTTIGIHEQYGGIYIGMKTYGMIVGNAIKKLYPRDGFKYISELFHKGYDDWTFMTVDESKNYMTFNEVHKSDNTSDYRVDTMRGVVVTRSPVPERETMIMRLGAYELSDSPKSTIWSPSDKAHIKLSTLDYNKKYTFIPIRRVPL